VAQVALGMEMALGTKIVFRADIVSDLESDVFVELVQEHPYLCASSISGNSLLYHFGKEDSHQCCSDES
jgi:hypothetical protein